MSEQPLTSCRLEPKDASSIKIIQITDTHILGDEESLFNDFDTSLSLLAVLDTIKNNEADADVILVTGDLVHDPNDSAYQKLADHLASVTTPLFYLPGNHDEPVKMDYIMGSNGFDPCKLIQIGDWVIVLLDTRVADEHAGEIDEAEQAFLQQCLDTNSEQHALIALHHHPVKIDSPWMDGMALKNPDDLFHVIDGSQRVKGVIWGHIHQAFESLRNNYRLLGTPSTCLQFRPGAEVFTLEDKPPAYRKLLLQADGQLETQVEYINFKTNN